MTPPYEFQPLLKELDRLRRENERLAAEVHRLESSERNTETFLRTHLVNLAELRKGVRQ